jgi:hypothetical protein
VPAEQHILRNQPFESISIGKEGLVRRVLKRAGMSFRGTSTCTTLDHALASHAAGESRTVDALDARDRKIIGAVIRALQRLLEDDDVRPALHEEQHARIVIQGDKVVLLAGLSAHAMLATSSRERNAPIHRLPPLQQRTRRAFAFG